MGEISDYLRSVFGWAGVDEIEAEEMSVFPGLDEIFALTDVKAFAERGDHDVLVVDCAPTAETIRFLSLPDLLGWSMERVFPVGRRVTKVAGPIVSRLSGGLPMASDDVFSATERFYAKLDGVRDLLSDPKQASVRLVVNPEKMVVAEARRTYTYLSLFGYRVDAVVANRVLPDDVTDPWFDRWRESQREQLGEIVESFDPVPVLTAPLASDAIVGFGALRSFAEVVYDESDAAAVLHDGEPFRLTSDGDALVMELDLPFADRGDLSVDRIDSDLIVTVGAYRRALLLPDSVARREIGAASLADGVLSVRFERTMGQNDR